MNAGDDRSKRLALDFAQIEIGRGVLWPFGLVLEYTGKIAFCRIALSKTFTASILKQRRDVARTMHDAHDFDLSSGWAIED